MTDAGTPARRSEDPERLPFPPGPRGHWLLGTSREWRHDLLAQMERMAREHGDAVRYHFAGGSHGYLFTHPDHLRHILQDNYKNYLKDHPTYLIMRPLVGRGILTSDGPSWLAHRRLMAPAFHRERIAALGALMTDAAEAMLAGWDAAARDGRVIEVDREITNLTLEIIGLSLFGSDLKAAAGDVLPSFTAVSDQVARFSVKPLGVLLLRLPFLRATRRLRAGIARLDAVVHDIIARRQAAAEPGDDLLGMLLSARDEETGTGMGAREVRDEVMTLLLAGHETVAQALTWTFYLLWRHPDVDERLRCELDEVLGGRSPTVQDLPRLAYLRMVVQESMRIFPPVYAFPRLARGADAVGGYRVEAGSMVTLSPYLTHRHPEFWPDPDRFDPERFTPERIAARPQYAYMPFAGGPRQCIGNTLALTETQLVLATVLRRYRLKLVPGHPVHPRAMIALRQSHGLPMTVTRLDSGASRRALVSCR